VERLGAVEVETERAYVNSNSIFRKVWVIRVQLGRKADEAIALPFCHVSKASHLFRLGLAWETGMW
jgi:hypothetical protein